MASTSDPFSVTRRDDWLIARFVDRQRMVSWAIVGGGFREACAVAWLEVRNPDLRPTVDPRALLRTRMEQYGLVDAVGLLTSRRLDAFVDVTREIDGVGGRCLATVGLGNALRAGDPVVNTRPVGTINLLCHVSVPLSDQALLEALALASEGKALAVREGEIPSFASGAPASGTGTDCIVIASPIAGDGIEPASYAGKHTLVGHLIGHVVHDAIARGVAACKAERS